MKTLRRTDAPVRFLTTLEDADGDAVDISAASLVRYIFQKPNGDVLPVTASFVTNGSNGQVQYVTTSTDIDQDGIWVYQVYVTLSGGVLHSTKARFKAESIIS